ncbi:MAG: L-fucokinase [Bryobacteraceae bacterium]|jgi:fucokinase
MSAATRCWDYLVLTASNALQARAYEDQLRARQELGLLPQVRETFVMPDLEGKRIGSGGSTLWCLVEILRREGARRGIDFTGSGAIQQALNDLRILIVHGGGDSRRLPAYGPCGKIFVPLPGAPEAPLPPALFDRLAPAFLALPAGIPGRGQVVVAAGDALIRFDARGVEFSQPGLIALGCYATPAEASRHGVFCLGAGGSVSLYLQKPSIETQETAGALDASGRAPLDLAVMHMDAATAAALLSTFGVEPAGKSSLDFALQARRQILERGLDLYREICCALGSAATLEHYVRNAHASGSTWSGELLAQVFPALRAIPFHVELVPECRFLHFGSTRQLIESGLALVAEDQGLPPSSTVLAVNSAVGGQGRVKGEHAWMEGCRITSLLELSGRNVIVGVDVDAALALPPEACLEVLRGRGRGGENVWFVRCYGVGDAFKHSLLEGGRFCGRPLLSWLAAAGIDPDEVWPGVEDPAKRSLWNARVSSAVREASGFRHWLWMYAPESASAAELRAFRSADRYSAAEIALLTDQAAFHRRRAEIWRSLSTQTRGAR